MRTRLATLAVLVVVTCAACAGSACAASRTTAPQVVVHIPVVLTTAGIKVATDKFTRGAISRYPRGAIIQFMMQNATSKAVSVRIVVDQTAQFLGQNHLAKINSAGSPIQPGTLRLFKIFFFFRGRFDMQMLGTTGKILATHEIVIF